MRNPSAGTLLLIRHGETAGNANGIIQHPDTPLNDNGLSQATLLAKKLSFEYGIDTILTSDYTRALQTARKIADNNNSTISVSSLLRERNFGKLRGTSYAELGNLDVFSESYTPPDGESWDKFHQRVDSAWEEIKKVKSEINGTLAVVTHGLVLRSLIERKLTIAPGMVSPEFVVGNTSVTAIEGSSPWKVRDLASVDHLIGKTMAHGIA